MYTILDAYNERIDSILFFQIMIYYEIIKIMIYAFFYTFDLAYTKSIEFPLHLENFLKLTIPDI